VHIDLLATTGKPATSVEMTNFAIRNKSQQSIRLKVQLDNAAARVGTSGNDDRNFRRGRAVGELAMRNAFVNFSQGAGIVRPAASTQTQIA
jgi:hypothetical protein